MTAFNIAKLNNNEDICYLLMNYYNMTDLEVTEVSMSLCVCVCVYQACVYNVCMHIYIIIIFMLLIVYYNILIIIDPSSFHV